MSDSIKNNPNIVIYDVETGPSSLELIGNLLKTVQYFSLPMIVLIIIHALWFYLFFRLKCSIVFSSIQFFITVYVIYISPTINTFLSDHWQQFLFSENYFDPNCTFVFTFIALPFSILAVFHIVLLFIDLCKSLAVHRYFDSIVPKTVQKKMKQKSE